MAYGDTSLSDVTLVCEGRIFPAHKIILAMRSKYFRAMFAHPGTSENQVGRTLIAPKSLLEVSSCPKTKQQILA